MNNIILTLHHYISYILLLLIVSIFIYFFFIKKIKLGINVYKYLVKKLFFIFHIQLLLGIILLFNKIYDIISSDLTFYNVIHNNSLRFMLLEHPSIMIISFIFLCILNFLLKNKIKNISQLKNINIFLLLIIILLLIRIPIKKLF